jgi:DNA-3-methyladenine glycosylase II
MSGEQQLEEGRVTKAIMVDGQIVVLRVGENGKGQRLGYELFSQEPLEPVEDSVVERISFFLSLGDDVKPFYSIAEKDDARFYPLIERSWGLHQVKFPTLMEICCWAVIVQRVQRPVALRMKRALTERFGGGLELDGKTYRAFPDFSRLKDATPKQLP